MGSLNTDVTGKAETRSHWSVEGFTCHNWVPKNAWSLDAGWGTGTQVKIGGRKGKTEADMEGRSEERQREETIEADDGGRGLEFRSGQAQDRSPQAERVLTAPPLGLFSGS